MMGKLIAVRMATEVPCHMHNCYNQIAYKLVHPNYADNMGMEIALICEECAQSLVESLQPRQVDPDTAAFDDLAETFMGQDAGLNRRRRPAK